MISTKNSIPSTVTAFPQLEIRTVEGKGQGVFAAAHIPVKTLVVIGKFLEESQARTSHSFQVDWDRHVHLSPEAELINHSCDPNLAVQTNRFGGYSFYAIKPIQLGEELTWDYGMTESESISVARCLCGSSQCRGKSVGFRELSPDQQSVLHSKGIASYLSDWYLSQFQERVQERAESLLESR